MGRAGYDQTLLDGKDSAAAEILDLEEVKKAVDAVRLHYISPGGTMIFTIHQDNAVVKAAAAEEAKLIKNKKSRGILVSTFAYSLVPLESI